MVEENGDLWYRKIGFYNNPFSIKPAPFDFRIIGQEELLDDLTYKVPSGTISFIEGPLGSGKSTLMKHLIHKFKGKGQVIFFSCNRIDSHLNIEKLLIDKYGFWGKMFKIHPKNMILLLDEAQELTSENTERIKYFFDSGNIKSIVFAGTDYASINLHESIKERIGDGVLKVKELSDEEAISIVRNRIGDLNLLNDDIVKKLFNLAGKNPRRLLQRCDKACRFLIENGYNEFTEDHYKQLFSDEEKLLEKPSSKEKPAPKAPKKEAKKEDKKETKKKSKKKPGKKKKEEDNPEENLYDEEKA
ncbi:MAG: hypothetical protein CMH64_04530 [Nanoarchaeota archaeon]|nr:hypothetical protein [Nanoarchaeota archaeon]|tara:strand:- start:5104 stop:6009 length:906 start_codon:yes stop_codon:yes gene_type:complete